MRVPARLRTVPAAYLGAAVLVVLLVLAGLVFGTGSSTTISVLPSVTDQQLAGLRTGAARDDVERVMGPGEDALDFLDTAAAVEPIDAECVYYPAELGYGVVQLCYRDDELASKRRYDPPPGFRPPGE